MSFSNSAISAKRVEEQAVKCKDVVYDDDGNKLQEIERVEVIQVVKRLPIP
jgi:hypothetical protein